MATSGVLGIFTDGDLRRQVERGADLRALTAGAVMHPRPKTVRRGAGRRGRRADGAAPHHFGGGAGCAGQRLVGMLTIGDLMRAKVV